WSGQSRRRSTPRSARSPGATRRGSPEPRLRPRRPDVADSASELAFPRRDALQGECFNLPGRARGGVDGDDVELGGAVDQDEALDESVGAGMTLDIRAVDLKRLVWSELCLEEL